MKSNKPLSVEETRKLMQHVKTLLPKPSELTKYYDTNVESTEKSIEKVTNEPIKEILVEPTKVNNDSHPLSVEDTGKMMNHVRSIWSKRNIK